MAVDSNRRLPQNRRRPRIFADQWGVSLDTSNGLLSLMHFYATGLRLKISAVLAAYIDESGMHANEESPFVAVAGYWAPEFRWKQFNEDWGEALRDFKLPMFHMTDFLAASNGKITARNREKLKPYLDWNTERFEKCGARFIETITRHKLEGFTYQVSRTDYEDLIVRPAHKVHKKYTKDPYVLLIDAAYERLLRYLEWVYRGEEYSEKLAMFFGQTSKKFQNWVSERHESWTRTRIGCRLLPSPTNPVFVSAEEQQFYPVQAADVLANLSRSYFRGKFHAHLASPGIEIHLRPLFRYKGVKHHCFTATELQNAQIRLAAKLERETAMAAAFEASALNR